MMSNALPALQDSFLALAGVGTAFRLGGRCRREAEPATIGRSRETAEAARHKGAWAQVCAHGPPRTRRPANDGRLPLRHLITRHRKSRAANQPIPRFQN